MTRWWAAAGLAGAVLLALLALSHLSKAAITAQPQATDSRPTGDGDESGPESTAEAGAPATAEESETATVGDAPVAGPEPATEADHPATGPDLDEAAAPGVGPAPVATDPSLSASALLVNVALTHGVLAGILLGGLAAFEVPWSALGAATGTELGVGLAIGVGLYVANEAGAAAADRVGLGHDEQLRELLAPDSAGGWVVLLVGVLPIVAGFEELLFRGILVGVLSAGFSVSPWLLAALSSVAFGLGHGAQGSTGVVVTGALGFALAAAFVLTGSLLAVVVAHYLVNALEFVVNEGLDVEMFG